MDCIIGIHSISEAIKNSQRSDLKIYYADDGLKDLQKRGQIGKEDLTRVEIEKLTPQDFQKKVESEFQSAGHQYQRVPSKIFLLAEPLPNRDLAWLFDAILTDPQKTILCLDQVTDVYNAAAILRTACFYGVDALLVSRKGNFGLGPSFFRIASGATEYVPVVNCSSLPKAINKLKNMGVSCVGLSEHATESLVPSRILRPLCLVLGAEDTGMSHGVSRVVDKTISFNGNGAVKSLNVSVAAAVALEKFFPV